MRVLVTWGSKRGGTEGIGRVVAGVLTRGGFDVAAQSVDGPHHLDSFDAVIVGGALYGNRWPANIRRFVGRNMARLRQVPVWFFSSGPLDDSAGRGVLPPPTEVAVLGERVGIQGHMTFGGRLAPDAKGFPASAMAKTHAGDWRDQEQIGAWALALANELPEALPGKGRDHPARSAPRWLAYGVAGWAICAAIMALLLTIGSPTVALVVHALLVPPVFILLARQYFRARGSREPLRTAVLWTALTALLDLVGVAGLLPGSLSMFGSIAGTWLPLALVFFGVWATGGIMATLPWPKLPKPNERSERPVGTALEQRT